MPYELARLDLSRKSYDHFTWIRPFDLGGYPYLKGERSDRSKNIKIVFFSIDLGGIRVFRKILNNFFTTACFGRISAIFRDRAS